MTAMINRAKNTKVIALATVFLAMLTFCDCAGKTSSKAYAQRMGSPNVSERRSAAKELRVRPRNSNLTPIILQACRDDDVDVRVYGFYALGKVDPRDEGTIAAVVAGATDTSIHVRRAVASAMGELNPFPSAIIPQMIKMLTDPDQKVREIIYSTFIDLQGAAVGSLMRQVDGGDAALRLSITKILGAIGPPAKIALPKLKNMSKADENEEVRAAAEAAVRRIEE